MGIRRESIVPMLCDCASGGTFTFCGEGVSNGLTRAWRSADMAWQSRACV